MVICSGQRAASRQACCITHSPIGPINPASSAMAINCVRRQQTALGVTPTQQRLGTEDAQIGQIDDRLVFQHELTARQRLGERRLQRPPLLQPLVHFRVIEAPGATAVGLRTIEREIGGFHQRTGIAAHPAAPGKCRC